MASCVHCTRPVYVEGWDECEDCYFAEARAAVIEARIVKEGLMRTVDDLIEQIKAEGRPR